MNASAPLAPYPALFYATRTTWAFLTIGAFFLAAMYATGSCALEIISLGLAPVGWIVAAIFGWILPNTRTVNAALLALLLIAPLAGGAIGMHFPAQNVCE